MAIEKAPLVSYFCKLLYFSFLLATSAYPAPLVGTVELVEGDVKILDAAKNERIPKTGDAIEEGVTIVTGKDGEFHAHMEDEGYVAVRRNTRITIVSYSAEAKETDNAVFSLLTGTFRSVTGWIGKYFPKHYTIRTPVATIGIRGTDHEPFFIPQGSDGAPGTYDKVNSGYTYIENQSGKVLVSPGTAGYASINTGIAPKLLERVPEFFRPTKNEELIEKRKVLLEKHIEEKFTHKKKVKEQGNEEHRHHRARKPRNEIR
jgi:hypothetical protein